MALIDPNASDRERKSMVTMLLLLGFFLLSMQLLVPPVVEAPPGTTPQTEGDPQDAQTGETQDPLAPPQNGDDSAGSAPMLRSVSDEDDIVLEDDVLQARFTNAGGALGVLRLKAYAPPKRPDLKGAGTPESWNPVARGIEIDREAAPRTVTGTGATQVDEAFHPHARNALRTEFLRPRDALLGTSNWQVVKDESGTTSEVTFASNVAGGIQVTKRITIDDGPWPGTGPVGDGADQVDSAGGYRLKIQVTVTNTAPATQSVEFTLYGISGSGSEGDPAIEAAHRGAQIGYLRKGASTLRINEDYSVQAVIDGLAESGNKARALRIEPASIDAECETILWVALGNHYFAGAIAPAVETRPYVRAVRLEPLLDTVALENAPLEERKPENFKMQLAGAFDVEAAGLRTGESRTFDFHFYCGPRLKSVIEPLGLEDLVRTVPICGVIHVGPFARFLTWCLNQINSVIGNYGWSILILTLIIKVILMPVNRKNQISMARYTEKMKRFAPRQKEIEARFKGKTDPKALQKKRNEMAQAMRDAGISVPIPPGCLLMLLQMPIFVGLFSALQNSIELRHAPWLWVADLSAPDHLFKMPFSLPFFGEYFNILPILMTVVWGLQSKISMKLQATAVMDEQQRMTMKMMAYMPIVFGVMFYNGASGLVLYWTVSTLISIFEIQFFKKAREEAIEKAKASVKGASA